MINSISKNISYAFQGIAQAISALCTRVCSVFAKAFLRKSEASKSLLTSNNNNSFTYTNPINRLESRITQVERRSHLFLARATANFNAGLRRVHQQCDQVDGIFKPCIGRPLDNMARNDATEVSELIARHQRDNCAALAARFPVVPSTKPTK